MSSMVLCSSSMAAGEVGSSRPDAPRRALGGMTLEKLKLDHCGNVYYAAAGQGLFYWGTKRAPNRRYQSLQDMQGELKLEQASELADPRFADYLTRDFRVPPDSPAIRMKAYPQGEVPDVRLGIITGKEGAP